MEQTNTVRRMHHVSSGFRPLCFEVGIVARLDGSDGVGPVWCGHDYLEGANLSVFAGL